MKTRKNRKRPDRQQKEKPFFSHKAGQNKTDPNAQPVFFQTKLTVGEPNDAFEKEADATANQVIHQSNSEVNRAGIRRKPLLQRQGGEQEEEMQTKLQRQEAEQEEEMQTRLQRQEAEQEEEMQTKLQRQETGQEEEMQTRLQRQEAEQEKEVTTKIQRKLEQSSNHNISRSNNSSSSSQKNDKTVSLDFEKRVKHLKGKGIPLPDDIKDTMEEQFGVSFGDVRVHVGPEAAQLTEMVNAQAFTYGSDIFFNSGKFNPRSQEGQHLIAHELTHVIQQRGASPSTK